MRSFTLFILLAIITIRGSAQVGIGTVSPTSTLDVRGSFSASYRSFTSSTTATATDYTIEFTGVAASSLTLPDATACTGRIYIIKNISTAGPTPVVTINTTSAQTIDGIATYLLDQPYQSVILVSNGAHWNISSQTAASGAGTAWVQGGNNTVALQKIGTISNFDLPFITNNTEKMRLTASGNLGVGTLTFNGTNPERFIVDAGATATNFQNVIVGKGNTNSYAQLNIQNTNAGANASSDVTANADNGNETTNYVDMGINSSVNTSGAMGGADDSYLYNVGQNMLFGTGTAGKSLIFLTGGTTQATNERMRIDGSGNMGIATNAPAAKLDISGTYKLGTAGTVLTNMIKSSFTITDNTLIPQATTRQINVTVTGATLNASVIVNPRTAISANLIISWARVSVLNTVTLTFTTSQDATIGTAIFDITVIQ